MLQIIDYPDNLPVKVEFLNIKEYPLHIHKDFQIILVLEGEIELRLTYTPYHLVKDDIHIIHNNDVHSITSITENNLILVLSINAEYFSKFFPNLKSQVFTTRVKEDASSYNYQYRIELKNHILSILTIYIQKTPDYDLKISNICNELIRTLYKNFRSFSVNSIEKAFEHGFSHDLFQVDRISRIASYVYDNYSYKLSLSDIAEDEHINKFYLSHLFQKFVGENFRDFVSMVRVELSEAKLLSTNMSVAQIAQECGFSNAKYYVEHFEKWFSCHPREYRDLYQKLTIEHRSPQVIFYEFEDIKDKIAGCLNILPDFNAMDKFEPILITIDLTAASFIPFDIFTDSVLEFSDPDLYKNELLEKNFYTVMEMLKSNKVRPKIILNESFNRIDTPDEIEPSVEYYNTIIQKDCIKILKELTQNDKIAKLKRINFIDSMNDKQGLFAINGLKKPHFYLLRFLSSLGKSLISFNSTYIMTQDGNNIQILLFNIHEDKMIDLNLNILNINKFYKLTRQELQANMSCIDFWCQLNFELEISPVDFAHIENMTTPMVNFEIMPKSKSYEYSISLSPYEIILITIDEKL